MGELRQIRRFGVWQTSKFMAVLYAIVTAIFFVPFGLVFLLVAAASGGGGGGAESVVGGTVGFLLLAGLGQIFYGIFGFLFVAITCAVYNVVAGWVGGIEVEVRDSGPGPGPLVPREPQSPIAS